MATHESNRVVVAALLGNVLVAATKVAAALVTGSSAMMSEAVHTAARLSHQEAMAEKLRAAPTRREVAIRDFFDVDHAVLNGRLDVPGLVVARAAAPQAGGRWRRGC